MTESEKDTGKRDQRPRNATTPERPRRRDALELLDDRSRRVLDMIARRWRQFSQTTRKRGRASDD